MAKTQVKEILQSDDSTKEKVTYLWEYYKWHLISILFAIFLIIYFGMELLGKPQYSLQIGIYGPDVSAAQVEEITTELNDLFQPLDTETQEATDLMTITATPTGMQSERFFAQLTAGDYDIILTEEENLPLLEENEQVYALQNTGLQEKSFYPSEDGTGINAIKASGFPLFNQYEFTEDLIVIVPENASHIDKINQFFSQQEIEAKVTAQE